MTRYLYMIIIITKFTPGSQRHFMETCCKKALFSFNACIFPKVKPFLSGRSVSLHYLLQQNINPRSYEVMQYIFAPKTCDVFGPEKMVFQF